MTPEYKQYYFYRFLEVVPGILVWATFITVIALSIIKPLYGIYFVIIFDIYFVLRITYTLIFLIISWFKYRKTMKVDWWKFLKTNHKVWDQYYHVILLPTAGEPYEVVERAFETLLKTKYDHKKMIVVLGGEARLKEQFQPIGEKILAKYKDS